MYNNKIQICIHNYYIDKMGSLTLTYFFCSIHVNIDTCNNDILNVHTVMSISIRTELAGPQNIRIQQSKINTLNLKKKKKKKILTSKQL